MYKIEELTKEEYDSYCASIPSLSFMQSSPWADFEQKVGVWKPHFLGIKDGSTILLAALFLEKKIAFGYSFYYAQRGIYFPLEKLDAFASFTKALKEYAKKNKVLFIKMNPEIKLQELDASGQVIEAGSNNFETLNNLKKLGYRHRGFNKKFDHSEPRYTFQLKLDKSLEEIQNNFHETTKKIIKRGNPYELEITKNENADIKDFYLTMMETAKRETVLYQDLAYYDTFYTVLHEKNMSDLYVVTANIPKIKAKLEQEINELTEKINTFTEKEDSKNKNKKQELINQRTKKEKTKEEVNKVTEEELVLSSILTAKYKSNVWTVYGGNHCLLRELNANYTIYYEIIKDAKKEGKELIDFFGTTYQPQVTDPEYGIHLFKRRLGGEYVEFIGEFDFVCNRLLYFFFLKLVPLYRNLKRKKLKKEGNHEIR